MAFGRVAIIGDVLLSQGRNVGAGVSKACEDVSALANAVTADDIESALLKFEAQRLPVGRRIIERGRHLGAYLQATQDRRGTRPRRALQHRAGGDRRDRAGRFLES